MRWHPQTIGDAVLEELGRFGPAGAMREIVSAWPEAVGAAIAENAWPARLGRDGTLSVATSSSVWAFELTQLEAEIRERLRERVGDAAPPRLRFAPGRIPERARDEGVTEAEKSPLAVGPEARQAGAEIAAPIEDEELRELVARAAAASLARRFPPTADRGLW